MYEIYYKAWDTINFGFKVGSVIIENLEFFSIETLKKQAKDYGFKLIYLQSPVELEYASLFYDEKIVYSKQNKVKKTISHYSEITSYDLDIITDELYKLSILSGEYSRYNLDENFPKEKFILLYNKWIENSILSNYATDVIVYKIKNEIVGLLTYKNQNDISNIGIIAVNPSFQGYGIGSKLLNYYQNQLDDNITELEVVTQGVNNKARAFYEKNGYKLKSKIYIYHLWL